ncbi:MAG: hypothetical protein AAGD22_00995 [Verrucomicrobiota bacterium]
MVASFLRSFIPNTSHRLPLPAAGSEGNCIIDSIFTIHFHSPVYRAVRTTHRKWIPKFAH